MRFVLKALFFLAVVAAFIPRQPEAEAAQTARPASAPEIAPIDVTDEARAAASGLCARKPSVCQTAEESLIAARLVGGMAVNQMRKAITAAGEPADTTAADAEPEPAVPAP